MLRKDNNNFDMKKIEPEFFHIVLNTVNIYFSVYFLTNSLIYINVSLGIYPFEIVSWLQKASRGKMNANYVANKAI